MVSSELRERTFDPGTVAISDAKGPPSEPPLGWLHRGAASWQNYRDILLDLAARFHIYAPDFRGHGGSGRVPARYCSQDYTADSIAFI